MEPIEEEYFNWLYAKVAGFPGRSSSTRYFSLLAVLHKREFEWMIRMDENRAEDGKQLRRDFMRDCRIDPYDVDPLWISLGCSFLEFLVAFCQRADFITAPTADWWFWHILTNLGLADINDGSYRRLAHRIGPAMETVIWRRYDHLGRGGMFPLQHSDRDQREVEVWHQLFEYCMHYNIT